MRLILDPGSCHKGKWEYVQEFIDLAAGLKIPFLKFQLFRQADYPDNIELPLKLFEEAVAYSRRTEGAPEIFASVFYEEAVDCLKDIGIKKAKLSYIQNFNLKLIRKLKKEEFEIWASGDYQNYPYYADEKFFCVSQYPPTFRYCGVFKIFEGFSSHWLGYQEDQKILEMNNHVKYLEKHITLDHDDIDVPDHWFALTPKELKEMCQLLNG